jgi:amino acid adenylation domain-containing protein
MYTTGKSKPDFEAVPLIREEASGATPIEARVAAASGSAPSSAQERLWFLIQINPQDTAANIARAVRVVGPLNREVLQRSLQSMIYRHETLRTTFATAQLYAGIDSRPVQLVAEAGSFSFDFVDLSETAKPDVEATAEQLMRKRVRQPFDLSVGPLIRATLIRVAEQSHILLITAHRIIADEESLKILFRELWQVYAAAGDLDAAHLPPLPVQYADFAAAQLHTLQSEAANSSIDYWRQSLAGAPPVVELPADRTRAPLRTTGATNISLVVDAKLVARLRALAADKQVSLRTLLLAAYTILLSRYSSQEQMVVGLELANRDVEEVCNLVGPLANVLPLKIDLSPEETFVHLLHRWDQLLLEAGKHAFVPFEKLLQELNVERSLSRSPLVQVTFNFQTGDETRAHVGGLDLEELVLGSSTNSFEVSLHVVLKCDRLECRWEYNEALYDATLIEQLAGHFPVLLNGIVDGPLQTISALPLLNERDREQVLVAWNQTEAAYESGHCLAELFEAQVERTPQALAVADEKQRLSYAELERRANQLASRLRREGVGCESLVAVCLERSVEMLVAVLGVLKAGGAYVPLDPSYPEARLRFMLTDTAAEVVLTEQHLAARLPSVGSKQLWLDSEREQLRAESESRPPRVSRPESLGYVIYTSGSTGRPKGVAIEQRSTVALLQWAQQVFRREDLAAVLASTSICFDLSVFEMFLPLSVGGAVIVAQDALQLANADWMAHSGVELSLINTVPSAMAELVRLGCLPASVRVVNLAGEPLSQTLVEQLYEQSGIERVYDLYGPTEDTTYSTYALRGVKEAATIGRPIANTQVYLLDSWLEPVPVGVAGELYLGGAGLARGYLKRPELTAERFIPNPYGPRGARLYRTGDLARYQRDGKLQYLGRRDQQVKLRGYRIELGEIEAVLRQHPFVGEVAVTLHERRLIAYVVRSAEAKGAKLTTALREFVSSKLPEYMVPAFFVELDVLPLTSNGKIDRKALPAPEVGVHFAKDHVAPRDNVEAQMANLWAKILHVNVVGVTDNFFELGGDSLLAARLFAQIHNRFGKNLPLSTLFTAPTIEQLTKTLSTEGGVTWSSLVPIQPHGSKPPLFCVHAAGANVLIYRPLSRHLGDDQPVYALQAQGLDGREPYRCVEDMAAHYVKQIRAFQPNGPYYLLGASFGGLVSYEVAHQLLAQGQEVAFLGLLNTNCPVYSLRKRLSCHLGHLKQRGLWNYSSDLARRLRQRLNPANSGDDPAGSQANVQSVVQDPQDAALVRTVAAILEAEQNYRPANRRYPGRITFFWADDAPRDFEDNRSAWTSVAAGKCEIHLVPGTHTKMREEPHVQKLVEKLKPCLEKAQALNI